jgi:hypothetical protein
MSFAEEVNSKRATTIERLESAQRLAKEINDPMADYMISMTLMTSARASGQKPHLFDGQPVIASLRRRLTMASQKGFLTLNKMSPTDGRAHDADTTIRFQQGGRLGADAVPMVPGLVLLEEPAEPVPLEPLAIAGALGALPVVVVVVLPEPAFADLSCTLPCASLQCVAAETLELAPDMPELEEPLD